MTNDHLTEEFKKGQAETGSARAIIIVVIAVGGLIALGVIPRLHRNDRADETAQAASNKPIVSVVRSRTADAASELQLPGNVEPINVAVLYARTNGYLHERFVDIGAKVKKGQTLAVVESPEVDQELATGRATLEQAKGALEQAIANLGQARAFAKQAEANVAQARANEELANRTNERWTRLVANGVLPKQQGDERQLAYTARQAETEASRAAQTTAEATIVSRTADVSAARATVNAREADVRRLEELQSFEHIVAPFDGVVTERQVEKGDLVSAGSANEHGLFTVAQAKTLRIQIYVPQTFAISLKVGETARVTLRELPNEKFEGKIARTAESITPGTRTLLTEVQVDNSDSRLLPGMYAEVTLGVRRDKPVIVIPGSALIANAEGTRVATVGSDQRVHIVSVEPGTDTGVEVEILSGLSGTDLVINNPPDTLTEGQSVSFTPPAKENAR